MNEVTCPDPLNDYIFTIAPVSTIYLVDVIDGGNLYMLRNPQTGYH
jgi:hypothetical protein